MIPSILLIAIMVALILATVIYAGRRSSPELTGEITALRQEVAALREEVAQLRNGNSSRLESLASNGGHYRNGETYSAAEISSQLRALQSQQAAERSELFSNLLEIALDRGSDAWARGDFKKAMRLLKPLAESGQPIAEHRVGVMYMLGQGVEKDSAEAIKWFSKAADQGQGESQHSLGLRYLWGDGVDKEPDKAAAWFTAAANQGIPDSATWLADMYWTGNGVAADPVEAYKWMLLSGDKFSINHRNGVTIEQFAAQLTPSQLTEAQQRAKNFVPQRTGPEDF